MLTTKDVPAQWWWRNPTRWYQRCTILNFFKLMILNYNIKKETVKRYYLKTCLVCTRDTIWCAACLPMATKRKLHHYTKKSHTASYIGIWLRQNS